MKVPDLKVPDWFTNALKSKFAFAASQLALCAIMVANIYWSWPSPFIAIISSIPIGIAISGLFYNRAFRRVFIEDKKFREESAAQFVEGMRHAMEIVKDEARRQGMEIEFDGPERAKISGPHPGKLH